MSGTPDIDTLSQLETAWKIINLQADTALKRKQDKYEGVKVLIAGLAGGAAIVGATIALTKLFGG